MIRILYFGATHCGQCKALKPQLNLECDRLGLEYEYLNTDDDDAMQVAELYGVRNLPTLIFLKDDKVVGRAIGVNAWKEIERYEKV